LCLFSDTLHSLSLKYNVQLSELKRVNNILQESALLTDILPGVHSEENSQGNGWYVDHRQGWQ
jgi:hypothetical protein